MATRIGLRATAPMSRGRLVVSGISQIELLKQMTPDPGTYPQAATLCNWLRQLGKVNEVANAPTKVYLPSEKDAIAFVRCYQGAPATPSPLFYGILEAWTQLQAYLQTVLGYSSQVMNPQGNGWNDKGQLQFWILPTINLIGGYLTLQVEVVTVNPLGLDGITYSVTTLWIKT